MVKPFTQFIDQQGDVHPTLEDAAIADIAASLKLNIGIARTILEHRGMIESVFAEVDQIKLAYGEEIERQAADRRQRTQAQPAAQAGA